MRLNYDERTALFLSVASPARVWRLLDTFGGDRFAQVLGAKKELLWRDPDRSMVEEMRRDEHFEYFDRELRRDSRRVFWPGQLISASQLRWVPPLVKLAFVLQQLPPRRRLTVSGAMEPALKDYLRQRCRAGWRFAPEAAKELLHHARFDPQLFDRFVARCPSASAEWFIDRFFFGVKDILQLCELSPVTAVSSRKPKFRRNPSEVVEMELSAASVDEMSRMHHLAIVLMSLPPELSAQIFKEMKPEAVHAVTLKISQLPALSREVVEQAVEAAAACSLEELQSIARDDIEGLSRKLVAYVSEEFE